MCVCVRVCVYIHIYLYVIHTYTHKYYIYIYIYIYILIYCIYIYIYIYIRNFYSKNSFKILTVYTRVSCDLVYHATLKILASKHYFIIYYEYHASCIFERPDKIVLGRLGYDCRTR